MAMCPLIIEIRLYADLTIFFFRAAFGNTSSGTFSGQWESTFYPPFSIYFPFRSTVAPNSNAVAINIVSISKNPVNAPAIRGINASPA